MDKIFILHLEESIAMKEWAEEPDGD
jgi:hypothetical protein